MKNYKYGDEILVKARFLHFFDNDPIIELVGTDTGKYEMHISSECICASEMSADEAWEIAKKFNSLSGDALIEIFDTDDIPYILDNLTFWNIKEKIEEWESNKIEVGDFVEFEGRALLVTSILGEYCCGIDMNGIVYSEKKKYTKKTGRHINIDKILKEIGDADVQRDN